MLSTMKQILRWHQLCVLCSSSDPSTPRPMCMVPTGLAWGHMDHAGWQGRHGTAATACSAVDGMSPAP